MKFGRRNKYFQRKQHFTQRCNLLISWFTGNTDPIWCAAMHLKNKVIKYWMGSFKRHFKEILYAYACVTKRVKFEDKVISPQPVKGEISKAPTLTTYWKCFKPQLPPVQIYNAFWSNNPFNGRISCHYLSSRAGCNFFRPLSPGLARVWFKPTRVG